MNSATHNTGIRAWRYAVTREDRKDLGRLLAPVARPERVYRRDNASGAITFNNRLRFVNPMGTRWEFVPR